MHIYFSGLGGVAIGPLAEIAYDAGHTVSGSDNSHSLMTDQLAKRGIDVHIGQTEEHIAQLHAERPIDWLVYTAALPADHPELSFARGTGIRISKRDELLADIIKQRDLKLVAVSGTHGKTTTTGLLIWVCGQLGIDISYSVGSTLSFGPSGQFNSGSQYFIYECDEFDRNMLAFRPHLSLITSLDHDHIDTYPTVDDYRQAFVRFLEQSDYSLLWEKDLRYLQADPQADLEAYDELMDLSDINLPGDHTRHNAYLVERAVKRLAPDVEQADLLAALNSFPGTGRRMEKLAENLYSDYGHHPVEIAATLQMANELSDNVCLVYQPHQNTRQHDIKKDYVDCMQRAKAIYWLPTYLTREDPELPVLTPQDLTANLSNPVESIHYAELDDRLWDNIEQRRTEGQLVLIMGAGSVDDWVRQRLAAKK